MMSGSVPPSRPPDNVPSRSEGSPSRPDSQPKKPFNLPRKTPPGGNAQQQAENAKNDEMAALKKKFEEAEKDAKKELNEKKKGDGKGALADAAMQAKLQMEESAKGIQGAQAISSIQAKESVTKISALIQKMVEKMQVGTVAGQRVASMELKSTPDVPSYFANSTLTLTETDKGLVISFSNFDTPLNEKLAINAVESSKNELALLVNNLAALNIKIADFQLGNHSIALPGLPPPLSAVQTEGSTFRDRGESDQGGGQGQDKEPSDEGKR